MSNILFVLINMQALNEHSAPPVIFSVVFGGLISIIVLKRFPDLIQNVLVNWSSTSSDDISDAPLSEASSVPKSTNIPGGPSPMDMSDDPIINLYLSNDLVSNPSWREEATVVDDKDKDTPDSWIPRHCSLIRLTGRHPFNCEAPLSKLVEKGFITPRSLHYVRNHGYAPSIEWSKHRIFLSSHINMKSILLTMDDLLQLPIYSRAVTLVCCGNRRKEQNMIKQTKGFNWGAAGVSTGVWTGVRLSDVLKLIGVTDLTVSILFIYI